MAAAVPALQFPFKGSDGLAYTGETLPLDAAGNVATSVFTPVRSSSNAGLTVGLAVGPTATSPSVALAACVATSYRVRNAATSGSPVAFLLATSSTLTPVVPTPYTAAGTGGTAGDKMIDPGGVEVIGLSATQQTALAAGTLYLSAVTPPGGSATLYITPGVGE